MKDKIEELTLLLLYLTGWDEEQYVYDEKENLDKEKMINSWKGYSFDALNELTDKGYLYTSKHSTKSVTLTKNGKKQAELLMEKYFKNETK